MSGSMAISQSNCGSNLFNPVAGLVFSLAADSTVLPCCLSCWLKSPAERALRALGRWPFAPGPAQTPAALTPWAVHQGTVAMSYAL